MKSLILVYPDPSKYYTLLTDTWSAFVIQEYTSVIDSKNLRNQHSINYVCVFFQDSQWNWAALTKIEYVINMASMNLFFYLADATITL